MREETFSDGRHQPIMASAGGRVLRQMRRAPTRAGGIFCAEYKQAIENRVDP
jgi:hypothetical protein